MPHDIIDNRSEKLLEHIQCILPTSERVRFVVGYLFLSGLKPIRAELERLCEIRLLIGNTTNRETLETLAEGCKRLDMLNEVIEDWRYPKRIEMQRFVLDTNVLISGVIVVKKYPEILEYTADLLDYIRANALLVSGIPEAAVVKDDPDDDFIISCAVEGNTDYIVSGDPHLLDLQS